MSTPGGAAADQSAPGAGHAVSSRAPDPVDLRLAAPALCGWAAAYWASALPTAGAWPRALSAGGALVLLAIALVPSTRRFNPPRHRRDPRPGAQVPGGGAIGSLSATVMVCALAASAVLVVSAAQSWARSRDPLTAAAVQERTVTLTGAVTREPRVVAGPGSTLILTEIAVDSVETEPSALSATVLGGQEWLEAPMGSRVQVRARLEATEPGERAGAIIPRSATVRVLEGPTGVLGAVTTLRRGLVEAVGPEVGAGHSGAPWPPGSRALVPGVALGDDHALPTRVRTDMRAVSMTHLTAVSGQHVVIVLGLALTVLGPVPRRWRALAGALVLMALVALVRPGGSVLRAAAMGGVMLTGVALGRRSASLPALGASVLLLLLVDPWQAHDYGFALSVAATAGILLTARPLEVWLSRRLPRWLAAALALPVAAQAACAPLLVLLQPTVGLWALPANMLAAPAVPVATVCGLLAALLAPVWEGGARLVAWPALAACAWLVQVARLFASLPGAALPWPSGVGGAALLAGCEAAAVALAAGWGRWRSRTGPAGA